MLDPILALLPYLGTMRSLATNVFFVRKPELAQEPPDGIGMGLNATCIEQSGCQFRHCDVAILTDNLNEKGALRLKFTFPLRSALRCCTRLACATDRKPPTRARRRRQLQAKGRRAPA